MMRTMKQCMIMSALAIASTVQAVPYYWSGGDGTWDTATFNWKYGGADGTSTNWPADDATAEAVFDGTGRTVEVSGTINAGKLTFNSGGWSVTNGTLVLKGGSTLSVNAQTSTVFSAIQGTVGLTITGGGMLSLRGTNNTYTGGTIITNASVWFSPIASVNNILGAGSTGNVRFDKATLIILMGSTYTLNWDMTIGSGGATFVVDGGGVNAYMTVGASKLSGSGTLTLTRAGTTERLVGVGVGQPNFAGKWIIDNIYYDPPLTSWGTATGDDVITLRNGGYLMADNKANTTPLTVGNTNQGIRVENNGINAFFVSGNNIASWIINAKITGPGDPVMIYACKSSSLATILANPQNSYSGVTDLYPGTTPYEGYVRLGASEVIPNGTGKGHVRFRGTSSRFALLDLNGQTETVNALETGVETGGTGGMILNTSNAPATVIVGDANTSGKTFRGNIMQTSGTISFTKIGSGVQTLSGTNTYAGGTVLSEGVLSVSSTNNIGGANARLIFAGGTLRITGTAFNSFGATPVSGSGTLEIVEAGNLFTLAGNVPATLTKRGAGTLTVSGILDGVITEQPGLVATSGGGVVSNWTVKALAPNTMYVASGTQAVSGNLTLSGNYTFNLNTDGSCDTFASTGNVVLDSVIVTVADPSKLTDRSKSYTLVTAGADKTVSVTGNAPVATNLPMNWKLQVVGQSLMVRYVPAGTLVRFL